jgi:hypothetical protein
MHLFGYLYKDYHDARSLEDKVSITCLSYAFLVEMHFKYWRWSPNFRARTIQAMAVAVVESGPR